MTVAQHERIVAALSPAGGGVAMPECESLRYYVGNPSAWPDGYSEQVSGAIRRAIVAKVKNNTTQWTRMD